MRPTKFFSLEAYPNAFPRWYLSCPVDAAGNEIDPRIFTEGRFVGAQPALTVPLSRSGPVFDFNFAAFDMVVLPAHIIDALEVLVGADIQRFPVTVSSSKGYFEILNVCKRVKCVDETTSEFDKWSEADGRPDKTGKYRMFVKMRIDPLKAAGHHLFRIDEWPIALIASEQVKELFESLNVTGVWFDPVT